MSSGYINLHRKICEWQWYSDINVRLLFIHLLMHANYKPYPFDGFIVPRGSIITGRKKLAESIGISEKKIRTAMDKLEKSGCITRKRASKYSLVKITKYEDYQDEKVVKKDVILKQKFNKITKKGQQRATIKEVINNNKLLYNNLTSVPCINDSSEKWDSCTETILQSEKWGEYDLLIRKFGLAEEVRFLNIYNFIKKHQKLKTDTDALAIIFKTEASLAINISDIYTMRRKAIVSPKLGKLKDEEAWRMLSLKILKQYRHDWCMEDMLIKTMNFIKKLIVKRCIQINSHVEIKAVRSETVSDKELQDNKYNKYLELPENERKRLCEIAENDLIKRNPKYKINKNCRILRFTVLEFMEKEMLIV